MCAVMCARSPGEAMALRNGIVTLTTDFGTRDAYVGAMKGVVCRILPTVRLVDITHEIPPQKVVEAALLLESAYPWFPAGTVHLVVVDPGVGTARRALAIEVGEQCFLGPDNGVLSAPLREPGARVHEISPGAYSLPERSDTFHGRDVFAPAAGHLAAGLEIERLGPRVSEFVLLDLPRPRVEADRIVGEVLRIDRFGNVLSNIPRSLLAELGAGPYEVIVNGAGFGRLCRRYQDAAPGQALALTGGDGRVEIAVHGGSAAERFRFVPGDRVEIHLASRGAGQTEKNGRGGT
jgi:S-adenosyl-L-methionine hydrolase (adenosine-forming)